MSLKEDEIYSQEEETEEESYLRWSFLDEKLSCCDKLTSILCCHCWGSTCCMRGTKSRRCAKKIFKRIGLG